MDKIVIQKQTSTSIRKNGVQVRISQEINSKLDELSEETGIAKTRIIDLLLRKALEQVEIVEEI